MPIKAPRCLLLSLVLAGCGGAGDPDGAALSGSADTAPAAATGPAERPESRTDTLMLEGMPEPISLRLYRAPEGFPLPFSAYVPEDMTAETATGESGQGSAVRFVARFGGVRNDAAFVHVFVHPPGTDPQQALGVVRAFQAADGIPVSRGLEPLGDAEAAGRMAWADQAYTIRYQGSDGWRLGSVGLGTHAGRMFHVLTHYPAEYGDGFGPRASLILETWWWADGEPLDGGPQQNSAFTVPSARTDTSGGAGAGDTTTRP